MDVDLGTSCLAVPSRVQSFLSALDAQCRTVVFEDSKSSDGMAIGFLGTLLGVFAQAFRPR